MLSLFLLLRDSLPTSTDDLEVVLCVEVAVLREHGHFSLTIFVGLGVKSILCIPHRPVRMARAVELAFLIVIVSRARDPNGNIWVNYAWMILP